MFLDHVSFFLGKHCRKMSYRHFRESRIIEKLKSRRNSWSYTFEPRSRYRLILAVYRSDQRRHFGHGKTAISLAQVKIQDQKLTYCMPMHILPPLEHAQKYRFGSFASAPSQRSGLNVSGS